VGHQPVLHGRVIELLAPALAAGGVFVDATLGRAGHARLLLEAAPQAVCVGIDRDPDALEASGTYLAPFEDRVRLERDHFSNLQAVLERLGIEAVRGVLFDLGVSSPQLDEAHRGFAFRQSGPLDMRMDPAQRLTAYDVVNGYDVRALARAISSYSEERFASRIARAIVANRPIETTERLAEVVKDAIPAPARRTGPHPARRTFQAIRIEVNRELDELSDALPQATEALEPGGRLVVISYHSLEDRIAKRWLAEQARDCVCPPDFPVCRCDARATMRLLTRRALRPGAQEIEENPRAGSARLRAAEKLGHASREAG